MTHRSSIVLTTLATALGLAALPAACGLPDEAPDDDDPSPELVAGGDDPSEELSATLLLADSLVEEGVAGRVLGGPMEPDSVPQPFYRDGVLYADARVVAGALDSAVRVEARGDRLVLDGRATEVEVEERGRALYAPVASVAREFGAWLHAEPSAQMGTLWPAGPLCAVARRSLAPGGTLNAPVFVGAAQAGALGVCELPEEPVVRELASADRAERWAANVLFEGTVPDSAALAFLEAHDAVPYAAFGWTRWDHRVAAPRTRPRSP